MDSERNIRMRMNVEGDRLSNLPDDLICKILSCIDVKQAIETSVLSSRWRFMWTSIPFLNISNEGFSRLPKFSKFFTHVLSRNNQAEISLNFHGKASQAFVKRILNKAFSHKVTQLTFTIILEKETKVPHSLFSSLSLKHLTILRSNHHRDTFITLPSTWELPALTTLHLEYVILYDDNTLFSKCENLKNLTLYSFSIRGSSRSKSLTICHPQLSSLTLNNRSMRVIVNVVAPQLENLSIIKCVGEHTISAPALTSLLFKDYSLDYFLDTDIFPSLEKLGICIRNPSKADAHKVVDLLQKLKNVKFLTLTLEIIELLESSVELIACQPSPFVNLTRINIYPELLNKPPMKVTTLSTVVKNYLLDGSPSATLNMLSHEEVRVMRDTKSAQDYMAQLILLVDQKKLQLEKRLEKMRFKYGRRTNMFSVHYLIDQNKQATNNIYRMGLLLNSIEALLINLPPSKKAELLPCFSSLRADTTTYKSSADTFFYRFIQNG